MSLKKLIAFTISISALIIAFSLTYYFVVFLPEKERAKLDLQRQEQKIKEQLLPIREEATQKAETERVTKLDQLNQCLDTARSDNSRITGNLLEWAERENKDGKYDLRGAFDSLERQLEQSLEECYRKYPQK